MTIYRRQDNDLHPAQVELIERDARIGHALSEVDRMLAAVGNTHSPIRDGLLDIRHCLDPTGTP